ncbi:lipopolysaccharide assembly protein LapA domain-containing protein [Pseudomonas sp. NA-150]|uniref:lipopolysaccharide assembly protein LapA domain-containing protein n=1 Tax=Pseudomonas sp. NA-150 TaxID=3367525 RepID=UPI0037C7D8C4
MRNLKRVMLVLICLLVISAEALFILENQQSVVLVFLGWSAPQLSVAVLMIAALLIGMVIGPILGGVGRWRKKRKAIRLV